ncbi:hypothetical protein I7I50_02290 [Histoplasma capsulatum G186AR]|uniref:Uncharacterized protein n=1 Tax=Ajellomyces capsulatus TaxID=5037 RepID=A0A8H7Z2R1_AJECA|nr:hypothetical protein I7I52_01046 [Histoplasma capsulatum]QSS71453.1 hypothetical protein I7I50_02290 [Histoplasma capsulatum G186AR]
MGLHVSALPSNYFTIFKKRNQDPNSICSPFVHPSMGISVLTSYCSRLVFFRHPLEAHSSSLAAHDLNLRQRWNLPLKFRDEDSSQRCEQAAFHFMLWLRSNTSGFFETIRQNS